MTTDQAVRSDSPPRPSSLDHATAIALAATEYERVASLFDRLSAEQWTRPTDCPDWDVRAMAGHMLGMVQMVATLPGFISQQVGSQRAAKRDGGLAIDALTALQVRRNAGLSTTEVLEQLRRLAPKATRMRRRVPPFIRRAKLSDAQAVGETKEWWTMGYLFDVILTRDPFMHRIDICRATGLSMEATSQHEGVLVDDAVREWAGRHGQPYHLTLSGPAGGTWQHGGDGETIQMDAFDFCRAIARRGPAEGLLSVEVPF